MPELPRLPFILLLRTGVDTDAVRKLPVPAAEAQRLTDTTESAREQRQLGLWLRRQVLARLSGQQPKDLGFSVDADGRPRLKDSTLDFNLSHTRDWLALAVSSDRVGVDLERSDRNRNWPALAERILAPHEQRHFAAAPDARELIRYWTLKEAWLKGLGCGISGGLSRTRFSFSGSRIRAWRPESGNRHDWRFGQRWIAEQVSLAWAARGIGRQAMALRQASLLAGAEPNLKLQAL